MAEAKAGGAAGRHENPLMPDERLRQMYTAMLQMRMLEEQMAGRRARSKKGAGGLATVRGQEAARASTALSLGGGDILSDCSASPGMDLLLGAKLADVKARARAKGTKAEPAAEVQEGQALRLPMAEDAGERLEIALGAAAALRAQGGGRVVLAYFGAGEGKKKRWKEALGVAGRRELPLIVLVLPAGLVLPPGPRAKSARRGRELHASSRGWGVPGFPVDGSDAIALYRVMQESLVRARSGGGPALIECIAFRPAGVERTTDEDPLDRLAGLMLTKGAADKAWMAETRTAFSRRLRGGQAR